MACGLHKSDCFETQTEGSNMRKRDYLFSALALGASLYAATVSADTATFGDGAGSALQNVFDGITVAPNPGDSSVDVVNDALSDAADSTWAITGSGGSVTTFIVELAGFALTNAFGIYDSTDENQFVTIFDGAATAGDQATVSILASGMVRINNSDTGISFGGNSFGYFLDSSARSDGGKWYSDTGLNSDNMDHMYAYEGTNTDTIQIDPFSAGLWTDKEYALAFEDLDKRVSDRDYTDMVVMVESVQPVPIPAAAWLFGSALVGVWGIGRRRKAA